MRTRKLSTGLLLAIIGFMAWAPAAYAQEEEGESQLSEETEECIHLAEEADDPEACQEAPNPILPATDELIWGALSFVGLFLLLRKYAYPQIKKGMETRAERIRSDLQAAQSQRTEAEAVLAQYQAQLKDARAEAGRILDEARQAADQLKRDQEARLQVELAEMRERAANEIAASKAQATEELRGDLAQLAVGAAEAVVQRNLDAETQNQLVEEYISQVAGSSA